MTSNSFSITGFCTYNFQWGTYKITELQSGEIEYSFLKNGNWEIFHIDGETSFSEAVESAKENTITDKEEAEKYQLQFV
jgi:hypothetical protein